MQRNTNQQMKKIMLPLLLFAPMFAHAATSESSMWSWSLHNVILILGIIMILIAFYVMYNAMNGMAKYQQREWLKANGIEMPKEIKGGSANIFSKLYDKAWSLVPMEKEADIDLGHDYDGIRELDNRLPPWWLWLFYLTIIWAIAYIYVNHVREDSISQQEEYEIAMEEARVQQLQFLASQANAVDETNVTQLLDEVSVTSGKEVFIANCAACHRADGGGSVGPNLTDEYWIHGGSINDIFKTIKYGVPEKGMIAWKSSLRPASIQKIASYIMTLQGTNPPDPKDPEGEKYIPEVTEEGLTSTEDEVTEG